MPKSQDQVNFVSTGRQMDKPITLPLVHVHGVKMSIMLEIMVLPISGKN